MLLPQLFLQRLTVTCIWSDCISGIIVTAAIILSFLSLMTFADFLAEQLLRYANGCAYNRQHSGVFASLRMANNIARNRVELSLINMRTVWIMGMFVYTLYTPFGLNFWLDAIHHQSAF